MNRIKKLKQDGVIKKYTVELDLDKVEKGFTVYVLVTANLNLLKQKKKTQYDVAKELRKFSFVKSADIVAGGADIVAIVQVKDVKEYDKALLGKIQLLDGVDKTQSLIVLH